MSTVERVRRGIIRHCTNDHHSVSCTTGTGIDGAILHVSRHYDLPGRYVIQRGTHDGMRFPSTDAAFAFALERGYCVEYFTERSLRESRVRRGSELRERIMGWKRENGYL